MFVTLGTRLKEPIMKKLVCLFLLCLTIVSAQEKWSTQKAVVTFEASVPLFEPIKAENKSVYCLLNPKKSSVFFEVKMKKFDFKRDLMEEHFNKHYLETKKYPKATFIGTILKLNLNQIGFVQTAYSIEGTLTIHGESKKLKVPAYIKKTGKEVVLRTNFYLNTDDFNIEIPFVVRDKIAKNVLVSLEAILK